MFIHLMSRKLAISIGAKYYFSGKKCKHGHISQRYVSSRECIECSSSEDSKNKMKDWRNKNSDHIKNYEKINKEKLRKRFKKYKDKNKDKIKKDIAEWREKNKEYVIQYRKKYYEENKEKILLKKKENPEPYRCSVRNRRARIKNSQGTHSKEDIISLLSKQKYFCANCRANVKNKYHVDHIMPIYLGGSNSIDNLQILCPTCNMRKNRKHPDQWAKENGRLF